MNKEFSMKRIRDNYDVIAAIILIAALAFAPSAVNNELRYVTFEQQPTVVILR